VDQRYVIIPAAPPVQITLAIVIMPTLIMVQRAQQILMPVIPAAVVVSIKRAVLAPVVVGEFIPEDSVIIWLLMMRVAVMMFVLCITEEFVHILRGMTTPAVPL
jgi:hypothetical protein